MSYDDYTSPDIILPSITICIPTYNRPELLRECLKSLIDIKLNEVLRFYVLVSDNSDNEEVRNVCNEYKSLLDLTYRKNEINEGGGRNVLNNLKNCKTKFIHIVSDKTKFNNKYSKVLPILIESNTKVAYLNYLIHEEVFNNQANSDEGISISHLDFEDGFSILSYKATHLSSLFFNLEGMSLKLCPTAYSQSDIPQTHFFFYISKFYNEVAIVDTVSISVGGNTKVAYDIFEVFYFDIMEIFHFYSLQWKKSSKIRLLYSHFRWLATALFRIEGISKYYIFSLECLRHIPKRSKIYYLVLGLVNDFSRLIHTIKFYNNLKITKKN
jgi:glycosyltransferase involved in cell wall biosynthesis